MKVKATILIKSVVVNNIHHKMKDEVFNLRPRSSSADFFGHVVMVDLKFHGGSGAKIGGGRTEAPAAFDLPFYGRNYIRIFN